MDWKKEIDAQMEFANVVLCLVSPDFLASDYCYEIEMRRALALHDEGRLIVLPVLLRYSSWHLSPLARLQALPGNGKPIIAWSDRDKAWLNVSNAIGAIHHKAPGHLAVELEEPERKKSFTVAVLGQTGVGKSSIINALLGKDAAEVGAFIPTTRSVQTFQWLLDETTINLVDCRSLGELELSNSEYRRREHEELLSASDLVIMVLSGFSKASSEAQRYARLFLGPFIFGPKRFILVINQVDLIPPQQEWDEENHAPGNTQALNIEKQLAYLAGALNLSANSILAVSALEDFNIEALKWRILKFLREMK